MDSSSFAGAFGSYTAPVQTPSPKKEAPARDAHGVLPVAIKTLLAAAAQCEQGDDFRIFGLPASKVIVCGVVEEAENLPANKLYRVKDMTGASIPIKDYTGYCAFAEKGSMVRAIGEVRLSEDEPFISLIQLTPVAEQSSLAYHLISATLAQCECTAGNPSKALDFTPVKTEQPASQQAFVKQDKLMSEDELSSAIQQSLRSAGESGSPLDALMRACPGNDVAVKAWVEKTVDTGLIFETGFGDVAHYACA